MSHADSPRPRHESEPLLADAVRGLSNRIDALQAEVRRLVPPALPTIEAPHDDGASEAERFAWIAALDPPVRRPPAVPRLVLESLFLLATALGAGLARLDALVIAAVMAGAWALVALIEWAALRASRSGPAIDAIAARTPRETVAADPAWLVPPVQQTVLEPPPEPSTTIAGLPPSQPAPDITVERAPTS